MPKNKKEQILQPGLEGEHSETTQVLIPPHGTLKTQHGGLNWLCDVAWAAEVPAKTSFAQMVLEARQTRRGPGPMLALNRIACSSPRAEADLGVSMARDTLRARSMCVIDPKNYPLAAEDVWQELARAAIRIRSPCSLTRTAPTTALEASSSKPALQCQVYRQISCFAACQLSPAPSAGGLKHQK